MAGKPQVTLTFAGDSDQLEKTFRSVGDASKQMSTDVGQASTSVRDVGSSYDRAGEAADNAEGKAQGFASTLTGTKDTAAGVGEILRGNTFEGFVMVGQGAADLAEGLNYTVIPTIKAVATGFIGQAASTVKATAAAGVHKVAMAAQAAATFGLTVAQKALNLAMRANPIGLIVTALFVLGGAFVAAWKKSETFRNVVKGALNAIVSAAKFVGNAIAAPFRAGFRAIRSAWNSTVGGKGFSIPSWVPIIGGKSFRIPRMHTGGVVPGAPGQEALAILQAGERVTPAGAGPAGVTLELRSSGSRVDDLLVELLRRAIRVKGGNVQAVLGAG
ncbi:MAG TPA: hypothetical protein VJP77_07800 [Planctomycetota bacterium]|nr:hypothetical protein [Planctomycetota bacterium]